MSRTLADICKEAIAVQDACNLSGVVHSFSRAMSELRTLLAGPEFSTTALNQHPVCVLYSSKIASLTGSEINATEYIGNAFTDSYRYCEAKS